MPRDPHKDQPILQGGAPLGAATSALILLHGRAGSAQEMLTLARELSPPSPEGRGGKGERYSGEPPVGTSPPVPLSLSGVGTSPPVPLSLSGEGEPRASSTAFFVPEAAGRQWYPFSLLEKVEKNSGALNSALGLLKRIMEKAGEANIPPERIALFGFSQGATVALEYVARNAHRYGAVIALSGALLGPEGTSRDYAGSLAGTPLFLGSGDRDPNIPKRRVDEAATVFERLGAVVTKQIYEGLAHAMNQQETEKAREILATISRG